MNPRLASGWDIAERAARRVYFATVEPPLIAVKKGCRLELFGVRDLAVLPCAELEPQHRPERRVPGCVAFIEHEMGQLSPFLFRGRDGFGPLHGLRGTPAIIDLDRFADANAYRGGAEAALERRHPAAGQEGASAGVLQPHDVS
jgi:hypothetical protein